MIYGLYSITEPDTAKLSRLKIGDLNCVAQRAAQNFDNALQGSSLPQKRMEDIQAWEREVHSSGASIECVANIEKNSHETDSHLGHL